MANRFAAEAYQVGDANMEFDATLDQMTIDADHENALGMESVDVGAMKNAALSAQFGMQGAVDTSGGIDIDGDGVIDVGGGAGAGAMMKFSEKFEIVHIPLGKSMGPSGDRRATSPTLRRRRTASSRATRATSPARATSTAARRTAAAR